MSTSYALTVVKYPTQILDQNQNLNLSPTTEELLAHDPAGLKFRHRYLSHEHQPAVRLSILGPRSIDMQLARLQELARRRVRIAVSSAKKQY